MKSLKELYEGLNEAKTDLGNMTYDEKSRIKNELDEIVTNVSKKLKELVGDKKTAIGLTPDSIKKSTEYKKLTREYDVAFNKLRDFNSKLTNKEKGQMSKDRRSNR